MKLGVITLDDYLTYIDTIEELVSLTFREGIDESDELNEFIEREESLTEGFISQRL